MKRIVLLFVVSIGIISACEMNETTKSSLQYPEAKRMETTDNYFGSVIADPYRWLEDDNSQETKNWVDSQNVVTKDYLDQIPFRQVMKDRLQKLWNFPKLSTPFKKGDFWYFYKNDGLQAQSVLYQMKTLTDTPVVFIDPNTFSKDGTVALSSMSFSKDGEYCAYSISKSGSDWNEIFVMKVDDKSLLNDHIEWVKFSGISWLGNGFFYSRFPEPKAGDALKGKNLNQMVYFHTLGKSQKEDELIYKDDANPERMFGIGTTKDEQFLILTRSDPKFRGNSLAYKKVGEKDWKIVKEIFDFQIDIIGNMGDKIYLQTNENAPKNKIVSFMANDPKQVITEVVAEKEDVLQGSEIRKNFLITVYLHDAASQAFVHNADGSIKHQVKLPDIGSLSGFSGDEENLILFYSFTSFTIPSLSYQYDIEANTSTVYRKSELDFDLSDYETHQIFFPSKDGTKIPMFVVHKKGIKLNGTNPTMLYGYGGFNISLTPSFSVDRLIWLEQGGIYVLVNLRGGGEYGEAWHEAGTKLNKQNVFDDFIAAAEYLIANKYTSKEYLAINGGSNGGLLVGATMTQRPDLMKVAFPAVGVLDMLRYHKFTIGYYWADDYGTSEDSTQFANLIKYSPLHNLKEKTCYPATLVTTADHDDRVFPAHSFKFAAQLQFVQSCDKPVLIRIDKNAGHGAGKPTDMLIQDKVDMWSFAFYQMGITPNYPIKK
jgi:prolyl oligopeptidase